MSRVGPAVTAFVGVLVAVAGVAVFLFANHRMAGFGWTAYTGSYAPLEPATPGVYPAPVDAHSSSLVLGGDWTVFWTGGHLLGAGLLVVGLLVLAAVAGWALGLRTARQRGH